MTNPHKPQEVTLTLSAEQAREILHDDDLDLAEHWADPNESDCWRCDLADKLRTALQEADK